MLSIDTKILETGSEARKRMLQYGNKMDHLSIFVYQSTPHRMLKETELSPNVSVTCLSSPSRIHFLWQAFWWGRRMIQEIREEKKENSCITTQDPFELGLIGYFLKIFYQVPWQVQIHTDFQSPFFRTENFKNFYRTILARFCVKRADTIRVVSERIKRSLKGLVDEKKLAVLPIFVDIEKIRLAPVRTHLHTLYPQFETIILMASRFTKEKNISLAIEAVTELVKKKNFNLGLVIVGDGPEKKQLQALIESRDMEDHIVLTPWTNDLASYYKSADIFLSTSNYEGYGRTSYEAAAAGLPVVMTDVGEPVGKVIPVGNKGSLVQVLSELIQNAQEREKVRESQQKVLATWPSLDEYIESFITSLPSS